MADPPNENGPVVTKAASNLTHSQDSPSTAIGSANPLRAINVEDIINAIGYHNDAAEARQALEATSTVIGSPVSFQADLDLLDTSNSAQLVFEAYTTGHLTDLEAVATIARINRGL